ncbi:hypothetical protein HB662_03835 [Roseomonas frigidaquae]|uniref:Uncharacterized protein n=1 Tax=Falsiroseomonas frigidaquae TaxID=487318 RepID=A0ABX1EW63_9PROT|nr:hypothetical protein [Falsiroseomonas frigidaquae]NKE43894.1 hypothetical protein [Falsiroseomonas frigidaquae]
MKPCLALAAGPASAGNPPIVEAARSPAPVAQALAATGQAPACAALDAMRQHHAQR